MQLLLLSVGDGDLDDATDSILIFLFLLRSSVGTDCSTSEFSLGGGVGLVPIDWLLCKELSHNPIKFPDETSSILSTTAQ